MDLIAGTIVAIGTVCNYCSMSNIQKHLEDGCQELTAVQGDSGEQANEVQAVAPPAEACPLQITDDVEMQPSTRPNSAAAAVPVPLD